MTAHIGRDPADSSERALQKRLAVLLFLGTVPLTTLWAVSYFVVGAPLAASIPLAYSIIAPINTGVFAWTRNFAFYRFTQLLLTLRSSLAGDGVAQPRRFRRSSSAVMTWAALTPLMALLVDDLRGAAYWIVGFAILLTAGALVATHPAAGRTSHRS